MASSKGLAVITGASSGIGRALAMEFADNGHDLIIAANEPERLESVKAELQGKVSVQCVDVDLRRREGVETLHRAIKDAGRPLEILAANAGIGFRGDFSQTNLQDEIDTIQLNVVSQVHLVKLVLPQMLAARDGKILITSSIIGLTPAPFMAIYGASKAFLHSFGQSIRNELKDSGVNVTLLMPGATDTDFWERANMEDARIAQGDLDDPADVARKAYKALMHDKDEVVPGLDNKLRAALGQMVPEQMVADNLRDAPFPKGQHAPSHKH